MHKQNDEMTTLLLVSEGIQFELQSPRQTTLFAFVGSQGFGLLIVYLCFPPAATWCFDGAPFRLCGAIAVAAWLDCVAEVVIGLLPDDPCLG